MSLNTLPRSTHETEESPETIKILGTQVQDVIKKIVGTKAFFGAFNNARKKVEHIRTDRKRKTAEQAVCDPAKVHLVRDALCLRCTS